MLRPIEFVTAKTSSAAAAAPGCTTKASTKDAKAKAAPAKDTGVSAYMDQCTCINSVSKHAQDPPEGPSGGPEGICICAGYLTKKSGSV